MGENRMSDVIIGVAIIIIAIFILVVDMPLLAKFIVCGVVFAISILADKWFGGGTV